MSATPKLAIIAPSQGSALYRAQEARPYAQSYHKLKEINRTQAHLMTLEGWQQLNCVIDYLGFRFNLITLKGTEFEPKPWRGRKESLL